MSPADLQRMSPPKKLDLDFAPRSQTQFGNALVFETLFHVRRIRMEIGETEFRAQARSQTEFGNEEKQGPL
jgi:hypothetical protein